MLDWLGHGILSTSHYFKLGEKSVPWHQQSRCFVEVQLVSYLREHANTSDEFPLRCVSPADFSRVITILLL